MNVLLIQPPITVTKGEIFGITPQLGLAYLASVAEQDGQHVKILDTIVEGYSSRFHENGLTRIGLEWDAIKKEVEKFNPDLVGISCPFTLMDKEMRTVAFLVKSVKPSVPVVVGGAHPSSMPEHVIRDPNVDFVVAGEGEKTFLELINKIVEGASFLDLKGLWLKVDGKIRRNERRELIMDLDLIPFPAWHLLPIEKYLQVGQAHGSHKRKRYMSMITSRGCPGRCVFCSIHSVWGYEWRARTPENVVDEIEKLVTEYRIREIHFEDDNLTLSKRRMAKICDLIIQRGLDISWTTPNGVAVNTLDLDLLEKMRKSGCYQLSFGIESGDPDVMREIINKPISLDRIRKVVSWSKSLGIWTHGFFVIGLPGESAQSIQKTISFAKETDLDSANFFIATPYPGTPLFSIASSEKSFRNDLDFLKLRTMDATMNTEHFKAKEMKQLQKKAYLEFMKYRLKREIVNGYILVRFSKIRTLDDVKFFMRKIIRFIHIFR